MLRKPHRIPIVAVAMKHQNLNSLSVSKMKKYHVITCLTHKLCPLPQFSNSSYYKCFCITQISLDLTFFQKSLISLLQILCESPNNVIYFQSYSKEHILTGMNYMRCS